MFAIYKRELKAYFRSFIGLLFIAVTLFFIGLYFFVNNILYGYPYLSYALGSIAFIFLISTPILSMRIMAEERRSKTDQLILTAPVTVGGIIWGKFLALLTIFVIPTAITCTYPLIMSRYGTVPMAESYLAILAFFLYGMAAIAIGVLISSLTESQVIAAVISFIVLFLGYMMSSICNAISATGNWLTKLLNCFDMYTPFAELLNGTLNLKSVVYFCLLTGLAIFLAVQSVQKRRYSVSVKNFTAGAYSTGMIALAVAIVAVVNLVLGELPASSLIVDVTAQRLYSLTDQSKEYAKGVQEDVTIYVIAAEATADATLAQTLQRFDDLSEHITVEYVDPNVNPRFYTQYTNSISMNSLIVAGEKRSKVVDYNDIYETTSDYDYYTGSYSTTTTGYDGEGQIMSALDYVLSDDMPKLYITEGHGEYDLSANFEKAVEKENVEYETIQLLEHEAVPEDAACVLINGAYKDMASDTKDKLIAYLERGGNIILVAGYSDEETPNMDALLDYMGLERTEGMVAELNGNNYYGSPFLLFPEQTYSDYTTGLYQQYLVFAPYAQGIIVKDEAAEGMYYETFLKTSDKAFARADLENMTSFEKQDGDAEGPFAIGVAAEKTMADGTVGTMVVYSSDQMFTDDADAMVSGSNRTLFMNTVSGFVNHDVTVSVPAKSYEITYLMVPRAQAIGIGFATAIFLPVGCLATGFIIWFRRRKR